MNITDAIWRSSFAWPERAAVIHDGRQMSYLDLRRTANLAAAQLFKIGVRRGDVAALRVNNPLAHLLLVLALARMGAATTALKRRDTTALKETLFKRHGVRWLVHDHDETWRSDSLPGGHIDVDDIFVPAQAGEQLKVPPMADDMDEKPWFIATSSGTTGVPKSIPQTHARSAILFSLSRPAWPKPPTIMVFVDLAISMGIGHVMRPLMTGGTVAVTASAEPAVFFEMIERDRPIRVITTSGLATRAAAYALQRLPQSLAMCASVQTIAVGGAGLPPRVREAIRTRICPQIDLTYSSTESGVLAVANLDTLAAQPNSAGLIQPWVEAQAVDENDRPLPAGTPGLLRFKTPTLVRGYLGDAEATARTFRNGWYCPGDTGFLNSAGYLFLAGRADDRINLGGRKLDPVLIENVLNEHPTVLESAVVAFAPDAVMVPMLVAVVVLQAPVEMEDLGSFCRERLGAALTPERILTAGELPKNEGGKLMRAQVAATLLRQVAPVAKASD